MSGFPRRILLATDGSEDAALADEQRPTSLESAAPSCTWHTSGRTYQPRTSDPSSTKVVRAATGPVVVYLHPRGVPEF